ncbi:MAG: hypothetical protein ACYSYV_00815 [Planctomycetota bacterium]
MKIARKRKALYQLRYRAYKLVLSKTCAEQGRTKPKKSPSGSKGRNTVCYWDCLGTITSVYFCTV